MQQVELTTLRAVSRVQGERDVLTSMSCTRSRVGAMNARELRPASGSTMLALAAAIVAGALPCGCGAAVQTRTATETAEESAPTALQTVSDDGDESVVDFYQALSMYGDWIEGSRFGTVWVPSAEVVGTDFEPYVTGGSWAPTDVGWVFRSQWDAAWGWATFHYGRWYDDDARGWSWVPDVVWGPAWVEWRHGGAYVGWAAMTPPGAKVAPDAYAFVETKRIAEAAVEAYRVPVANVAAAYAQTKPSREFRKHAAARAPLGPPASFVAAAGLDVLPTHQDVPGPGAIRTQGRMAASRPMAGAGKKKKASATGTPTPSPTSQRRGRGR
jgi:hypothetical protein